jgi:hypothetical protein
MREQERMREKSGREWRGEEKFGYCNLALRRDVQMREGRPLFIPGRQE